MKNKYFFDQDDDCHWYLIDNDMRFEWFQWKELASDPTESLSTPYFAQALGCNPSRYVFENPDKL